MTRDEFKVEKAAGRVKARGPCDHKMGCPWASQMDRAFHCPWCITEDPKILRYFDRLRTVCLAGPLPG